ncbi:MAG: apolipoprotein N-acyltransferase [Proteobacteria bacterium]|nr:apolipoprotein N-acyltransferase [Pseudomonadota bacterium]
MNINAKQIVTRRRLEFGPATVAIGSGALLPLAFAPFDYFLLAPVCLSALFWLWDQASPKSALIAGFLFGLGQFGFGVSWIQISVHQFGLPVYAFSVAITALFVLILSLYPALCGYLVASAPTRYRTLRILILFPIMWTSAEFLRGWLFTGFPWLLIGYSQVDSPLAVFAPIIGAYGISYVTCALSAIIVVFLVGDRIRRIACVVLVGLIALVSMSLQPVAWTTESGPPQTVALVQGAVPQEIKWSERYRQASIDLYSELSEPHWGKSLIIWPETAIPALPQQVPESIEYLTNKAAQTGTSLLIGLPTSDSSHKGELYNSLLQVGKHFGRYDKRHLVPFGEYLPLDVLLRPVTSFLSIPMSDFSAGKRYQELLRTDSFTIGSSICYEDAYANEILRALPAANVLVNISNDAWFGRSIAPHQHLQIARMRALETERYLLRATNTGFSAIINERGKIVVKSKQFVSEVVSGTMVPRAGLTPFARYGSTPMLLLCCCIIVSFYSFVLLRERRRPH